MGTPVRQAQGEQKGNILLVSLIVLFVAAISAAGYFYLSSSAKTPASVNTSAGKPAGQAKPDNTSSTPTPSDETTNWKTYTNIKYNFSFKYPTSASMSETTSIREQNNQEAGQFQIFVQTSGLNFVVDIQNLSPSTNRYYLGSKFQETKTINSIPWDTVTNSGYCDAGSCSQPLIAYQTIKNNQRFVFIFNNTTTKTQLQQDIFSTFKFTGSTPTPTCRQRPACLDREPRCLIPETPDMCPRTSP